MPKRCFQVSLIAAILAAFGALAVSGSCENLTGDWKVQVDGIFQKGMAKVTQSTDLKFINQGGGLSKGEFQEGDEFVVVVYALEWKLKGYLRKDEECKKTIRIIIVHGFVNNEGYLSQARRLASGSEALRRSGRRTEEIK